MRKNRKDTIESILWTSNNIHNNNSDAVKLFDSSGKTNDSDEWGSYKAN